MLDPHLARRGQRAGVIAVADHLPFAPERAVDRERQPDGQPVHAPAGAAGLVALDDEVAVVLLDRKVDHPEPVDRRPRDGAPERPEHARRAERRQSARRTDGDLHRVSGIDLRSRVVRHRRTAARLSPGALASATPRACHPEGQPQLPPSCRLDSAHVPLSAWTARGLRGDCVRELSRDGGCGRAVNGGAGTTERTRTARTAGAADFVSADVLRAPPDGSRSGRGGSRTPRRWICGCRQEPAEDVTNREGARHGTPQPFALAPPTWIAARG